MSCTHLIYLARTGILQSQIVENLCPYCTSPPFQVYVQHGKHPFFHAMSYAQELRRRLHCSDAVLDGVVVNKCQNSTPLTTNMSLALSVIEARLKSEFGRRSSEIDPKKMAIF
jgi:hypothetical protein